MDVTVKKVVGKNAPLRKEVDRPRLVPSIPSQSVAPPEDKTMISLDRDDETAASEQQNAGVRKTDYLSLLEKNAKCIPGPGQYDPKILKTKLSNIDWSRAPDRFKVKKESRNVLVH